MCLDPASLALIGTAATVIGTGVAIYGSVTSTNARVEAANASAAQDRRLAEYELEKGKKEEAAQRTKTAALLGRQRALMAASNLDLSSGSPLTILADTAQFGEVDAQNVRLNSQRRAAAYNTQADLTLKGAGDAASAGVLDVFSTAVSGVQTLSDKWYDRTLKQTPAVGAW